MTSQILNTKPTLYQQIIKSLGEITILANHILMHTDHDLSLKTKKPQHPVEAFLDLLLRSDSCLICQRPVDLRLLLLSYRFADVMSVYVVTIVLTKRST